MLHLQEKRKLWNRPSSLFLQFHAYMGESTSCYSSVYRQERGLFWMTTAVPYLDIISWWTWDSEPKSRYLSPSHKFTLWSNFQSQIVITMIFRGKIIQRLQISSRVLTVSELQFGKHRVHTLAHSFSSWSVTMLISQPSPSHWSNCILLSDSSLFVDYKTTEELCDNFVWATVSPEEIPEFLSSPIHCCALRVCLSQEIKRGKRHTFCFQTLPPMKDGTGFIQSHRHCPPGCTAANKNAGQTYIVF